MVSTIIHSWVMAFSMLPGPGTDREHQAFSIPYKPWHFHGFQHRASCFDQHPTVVHGQQLLMGQGIHMAPTPTIAYSVLTGISLLIEKNRKKNCLFIITYHISNIQDHFEILVHSMILQGQKHSVNKNTKRNEHIKQWIHRQFTNAIPNVFPS